MVITFCRQCNNEFIIKRCTRGIFCSRICYWNNMIGKKQNHPNAKRRSVWNKGLKLPELSGENSVRYIKDRTLLKDDHKDRGGQLHRDWSRNIKKRDNWKCRIADVNCDGRLEAHHILSWTDYPELRYIINNGITLCHAHHPFKRAEEKRLSPYFMDLVSVSKE